MITELEALDGIGRVSVTRTVNVEGFNWVVTFLSEVTPQLLAANGDGLTGAGARIAGVWDGVVGHVCVHRTPPPAISSHVAACSCGYFGTCGGYCLSPVSRTVTGVAATGRVTQTITETSTTVPEFTYALTGLLTGTQYLARVRASNVHGLGYYGSASSSKPMGAPGAPVVIAITLSGTSIKIVWNKPATNGDEISQCVRGVNMAAHAAARRPFVSAVHPTCFGRVCVHVCGLACIRVHQVPAAVGQLGRVCWPGEPRVARQPAVLLLPEPGCHHHVLLQRDWIARGTLGLPRLHSCTTHAPHSHVLLHTLVSRFFVYRRLRIRITSVSRPSTPWGQARTRRP